MQAVHYESTSLWLAETRQGLHGILLTDLKIQNTGHTSNRLRTHSSLWSSRGRFVVAFHRSHTDHPVEGVRNRYTPGETNYPLP